MKFYVIAMPPEEPEPATAVYSANKLSEAIIFVSNFVQQRIAIDDENIAIAIERKGSIFVGRNIAIDPFGGEMTTENIYITNYLPKGTVQ